MAKFDRSFAESFNKSVPFGASMFSRLQESAARGKRDKKQDARQVRQDERQARRDKYSEFTQFGGFDPELVMQGSLQATGAPMLEDEGMSRFQSSMIKNPDDYVSRSSGNGYNVPAAKAFEGFQQSLAEKRAYRGLPYDQQVSIAKIKGGIAKEVKGTPSGGRKMPNMGGAVTPLDTGDDKPSAVGGWLRGIFGGGDKTETPESNEVIRKVKGRDAIFDAKTKKFIRYK